MILAQEDKFFCLCFWAAVYNLMKVLTNLLGVLLLLTDELHQ